VPEGLAIAQVSPFAWEARTEVGHHVDRVSQELSARGHQVIVIAPSESAALVRESRALLRSDPHKLLEAASGQPLVLAAGELLPFAPNRRRAASIPVDVAKTVEEALTVLPLDVVHVHEPFAPSAASVALRNSRALNVATFHEPTERILATQLALPLSRSLFSRLDARISSYQATSELMQRFFPGKYRIIGPASDPVARAHKPGDRETTFVMVADEERAALRLFLRALRALPDEGWRAVVYSPRPLAAPATLSRVLRERVTFLSARESSPQEVLATADVAVFASEGLWPTPGVLAQALASGIVPIAARLPVYDELLGGRGLVFEPGDIETLSAHLSAVVRKLPSAPPREDLSFAGLASELEQVYAGLVARRHGRQPRAAAAMRERLARRPLIDVDLHMHTDHSYDCATPVEVLLAEAKARGLGAIAITDHNEVSGALDAAAKAEGIKVIVAEEVKTAAQGEVIGLFLTEKIEPGMTLQETIAEIKRQGGLVYVPHPFDRMHSVPDYEHLLAVLDDVDAIEVFNPRIAIPEFNEEAVRFAAKYRMTAGAGSDAHVPQGLGSVRIRMRDFDGPEEFLESLRDADILRNPASLFYVQALKFLQTKALPANARRASRDRRVRRVQRSG
jgi:glycosyltransferase involved in cell wall biosynthesis